MNDVSGSVALVSVRLRVWLAALILCGYFLTSSCCLADTIVTRRSLGQLPRSCSCRRVIPVNSRCVVIHSTTGHLGIFELDSEMRRWSLSASTKAVYQDVAVDNFNGNDWIIARRDSRSIVCFDLLCLLSGDAKGKWSLKDTMSSQITTMTAASGVLAVTVRRLTQRGFTDVVYLHTTPELAVVDSAHAPVDGMSITSLSLGCDGLHLGVGGVTADGKGCVGVVDLRRMPRRWTHAHSTGAILIDSICLSGRTPELHYSFIGGGEVGVGVMDRDAQILGEHSVLDLDSDVLAFSGISGGVFTSKAVVGDVCRPSLAASEWIEGINVTSAAPWFDANAWVVVSDGGFVELWSTVER